MNINISINEINDLLFLDTTKMITELMNYHRKLNNAPKEYWQTDEQSRVTLDEWMKQGSVYNIFLDNELVGFFYVRFGGQNVAWLEDLFIIEAYRNKGIGKIAMQKLDELMIERRVVSMFVDVIPRNTSAIKLYRECGFDHLNIIQLRKNYDERLNKKDDIEILGFNFKKY
ncbi:MULTISPECIES: GNAT family N-acetyltransferase [Paraclostridium]|nr:MULTISPECIES: GNAT family N-acetyltransferase [Paraclostridium]MBZ6004623.1 GNAT family N-acetyltransferase [Paraclostridium bifermentans]MCR1874345.1 GNAT family N-acetyltransferase [Paraclostridium bifermentans]MDU0296918.1 GNAT family N-acetyltransferase [Paraclostridium sp. MRS3W1]